jgi:hypothetical protein
LGVSYGAAFLWRLAANRVLDAVERTDAFEGFGRDGRSLRLVHLEELASHMRPTRRLLDGAVGVERVEPAIGIGLQDALEQFQMRLRMFAASVRRVGKPDGRRCLSPAGRSSRT